MSVEYFLGNLGGEGGGGAAGSWELAYVRRTSGPDGAPVPSGVTYDPNYEYMVGNTVGSPLPAITDSNLIHVLVSFQPLIYPNGRMFYTPDGGGNVYEMFGEDVCPLNAGATIARATQLTFGRIDLTAAWQFTTQSGVGIDRYFIIARRQVA
jgi:hypothetical protein